MTKKHAYTLYSTARNRRQWSRFDVEATGLYRCDAEAVDNFRMAAFSILYQDVRFYVFPLTSHSIYRQTYQIYDETDERVVSVFTLNAELKEEKL